MPTGLSAVDALAEIRGHVDIKCSEGICGVCAMEYSDGKVDHRDYVLSAAKRKRKALLCCSRAKDREGVNKVAH